MVMATQNPLESYGTFPLPEAQIDRFFMKLRLGYMTREQELSVLHRPPTLEILDTLVAVVTHRDTALLKSEFPKVHVSEVVGGYMMDIIAATRSHPRFTLGVSARGALALFKASQVTAAFSGRDYVIPEDVKKVAGPVLTHRIISSAVLRATKVGEDLAELIDTIPVPLETIQ